MVKYERVVALLKCLLAAYVITGVLLAVTAMILYRFQISETLVEISIIVTYVVASLLAGLFYAKGAKSRRFVWGMLAGSAYFLVICAISMAVSDNFSPLSNSCITTLLICGGSGMLGGMVG